MINKFFKQKGFSLIEVIIASFIFLIGTLGAITLIQQAIISGGVSLSKLVAANLAQEGIEVLKNIRDVSCLADGNGDGLPDYNWDYWYANTSNGDYLVQYNDVALRSFSDVALKLNGTTGLYGYDSGIESSFSFKRKVNLTKISNNEIKVTSTVTWVEKNRSHSLVVEDRLWNWR